MLDFVLSILVCFTGGFKIQNRFIAMFSTFADLERFATKAMDNELLGKIKIVKTYHHNLPVLIGKIESKCVRDERQAGRYSYYNTVMS